MLGPAWAPAAPVRGYIRNKVFEKERCAQVACVLFGPGSPHAWPCRQGAVDVADFARKSCLHRGVVHCGGHWWRSWDSSTRTADRKSQDAQTWQQSMASFPKACEELLSMQGWKDGRCTWSIMSWTAKMLGPRLFCGFKQCYSVSAVSLLPRIVYSAL